MLGLVKTGKGKGLLELRPLDTPRPGPGEALIEVKAAGICGTDIHIRHDDFPYWPPVVLGHEFSGIIVEVGAGVEGWRAGERVVAEPHAGACGVCDLCRTGYSQICAQKRSPGWGRDGAFAEYLVMPVSLLHRLPDGVGYDSGAVIEPLAVVLHEVVERGGIQAGDTVVVFGAGPIGLLAAAVARLGGAAKVILVGTSRDAAYRFGLGQKASVDTIIDATRENVVERVEEATDGRLADLAVEASGAPAAIAQVAEVIRKRGRITAVGLPGPGLVEFPWQTAMQKAADLYFNMSSSHTSWNRALALVGAGRIDPAFVVSDRFPLDRWEEAFDLAESGNRAKMLLIP